MGSDGLHQEPAAATLWNDTSPFPHVVEPFCQVYGPWLMVVSRDAKLCPIILLAKSTGDYKLCWEHVFVTISQGTLTLFIYRIVQAHEELIWEAQFTPTLSLPTKSQGTEPNFAPPQQKSCHFWLCHKKGKEMAVWKCFGNEKTSKEKHQGPIGVWQSAAKDHIPTILGNFAANLPVGSHLFAKQRALQREGINWLI